MCKKIPKTYQNLVCGRGSNSFSPLRATNLKLHVTSCHIFRLRLNTLKGTVIILTVLILDLSTLSVTNVHTPPPPPNRYDYHPPSFLYRSSRPAIRRTNPNNCECYLTAKTIQIHFISLSFF